jgi:hypothetical protein
LQDHERGQEFHGASIGQSLRPAGWGLRKWFQKLSAPRRVYCSPNRIPDFRAMCIRLRKSNLSPPIDV